MNASEHPAVVLLGYEEITGNDSGNCACGCPFEIHVGGTYVSAWTGWTIEGYKCSGCRCLLNLGLEVEDPGGECAFHGEHLEEGDAHWVSQGSHRPRIGEPARLGIREQGCKVRVGICGG